MIRETITAVVLTKNEERRIEKCLKSLTWVDEIVLIDGFSTDKTVEIAKRYNAKVYQHVMTEGFDAERNLGNAKAACDWILQLDADDVMTEEAKNKILEVLGKGDKGYAAYKTRRRTYFLGHFLRYGGWYHEFLCLFRKGKGVYSGRVHHVLKIDGRVGELGVDIEHYPFDSIEEVVHRFDFYTTIEAKEMLEKENIRDPGAIRSKIIWEPVKKLFKHYVRKKAYKDGIYGFMFSVLNGFYHFMRWSKYWVLVTKPQAVIARRPAPLDFARDKSRDSSQ